MCERDDNFVTITVGAEWLKDRMSKIEIETIETLDKAYYLAHCGNVEEAAFMLGEALQVYMRETMKLAADIFKK